MTKPRILYFDIETSPNVGYTWGKWQQNVIEFEEQWTVLCFCYKWEGRGEKVHAVAQPDFDDYDGGYLNDYNVVKALWDLFDEADILVAHNGDRFDITKMTARFAVHNMEPPSPYMTIDTKKYGSRYFRFNQNSLDMLGETLGLGRKVKHDGFEMWLGCMAGEEKHWKAMVNYNKMDVTLLQKVYKRLMPFVKHHPNLALISGNLDACPKCGDDKGFTRRGYYYTGVSKFVKRQCKSCGGYSKDRLAVSTRETRPSKTSI